MSPITNRVARRVVAVAAATTLPLSILMTACGAGSEDRHNDGGQLDGREFLSRSVAGRLLVSGTQIRLTFDRGRIGASAGCNALGGPYELVDGRLIIRGGMTMTEIGCDTPRHAQDEWLADLLQSEPQINLAENTLTVKAAEVMLRLLDRVVADPDRPLVGTRWTG